MNLVPPRLTQHSGLANKLCAEHVFFFFFLSPLFAPYLINPNVIPFYTIPAIALLALICILLREKREPPKLPVIIAIILFLSLPFTYDSNALYMSYSLAATVLFAGLLSRQKLISAHYIFMFSTAVIILVSLYVWLGWDGNEALHFFGWALTTDRQVKMGGPLANGNVLAIIILCAWCTSVFYWLNDAKKTQWLWLIILLFFWIYIFSSMARGAWVAQFIIIIWLIAELTKRKEHKKTSVLLLAGLIAWHIGGTLTQHIQPQFGGVQQQFEKTAASGMEARLTLWASVWEVYKTHPILGVGASQLKAHYLTGQSVALENSPAASGLGATDSAHNILLHLLVEYGIAGLLLWLIVSLLLMKQVWIYKSRLDSFRWPAVACTLVLWIQGHANISLTEPYPLILFAFMLGICCKPSFRNQSLQINKKWLLVSTIIVFSLLVNGGIQTTKAWHAFGQWTRMDYKNPEKGSIASSLARNEELFPYIVEFSIAELSHLPGKQKQISKMRPLILRAISLHERPRLYKELFLAHLIDNNLDAACKVGKFIRKQQWGNEPNSKAYSDVCIGIKPNAYSF